MKKTLISLLLVVMLVLALAVPAMAATPTPVVVDGTQTTITVSEDTYLDLAGISLEKIVIENGAKLYLYDSSTDDYIDGAEAKVGTIEGGEPVRAFVLPADVGAGRYRYITIQEDDGSFSAHRFYIGVTSSLLYPKTGSLYFKLTYKGDATLTGYVDKFGGKFAATEKAGQMTAEPDTSFTKDLTGGATNERTVGIGNLLNADLSMEDLLTRTVDAYLSSQAYLQLKDKIGGEVTSSIVSKTFKETVLAAQAEVDGKTAAQVKSDATRIGQLTAMYQRVITAQKGDLLKTWSNGYNAETGEGVRIPYYCECGAADGKHLAGCNETALLWIPYDQSGNINNLASDATDKAEYNFYLTKETAASFRPNYSGVSSQDDTDPLTIRVNLNGYNITNGASRVFQTGYDYSIVLCNTRPMITTGGVIQGKGSSEGTGNYHYGAVFTTMKTAGDKGVIKMLDGVTLKQTDTHNNMVRAGILNLNYCTFTMYGGTIEGTTVKHLVVGDSGVTTASTATPIGGAVQVGGTAVLDMKGGVIQNGAAEQGGNVYVDAGGRLVMSGNAVIKGGHRIAGGGNAGGNVMLAEVSTVPTLPTLEMSGNAEISGGKVWYAGMTGNGNGGNIWMGKNTYLKMNDTAHIVKGEAKNNGGNINNNGGIVEMYGDSFMSGGISGRSTATNGTKLNSGAMDLWLIAGGKLRAYGGAVQYVGVYSTSTASTIEVKGSPVLPNVYVSASGVLPNVVGEITDDALIRVRDLSSGSIGKITATLDAAQTDKVERAFQGGTSSLPGVVADGSTAITLGTEVRHCICGAAKTTEEATTVTHATGCSKEVVKWAPYSADTCLTADVTETKYYYLITNLSKGQFTAGDGTRVIDLNGFTYTSTARWFITDGADDAASVITVCNTAPAMEGAATITCKGYEGSNTGAVMLRKTGDTLNVLNVTIQAADDIYEQTQAGLINVGSGCVLNMYNGILSGGKVSGTGGVVRVAGGTFTMHDGLITGGSANQGGGVHVDSSGTFNMYGGTITGNSAKYTTEGNGGGIYANGIVNIYGGSVIDNDASQAANKDMNLINNKAANIVDAEIGYVQALSFQSTTAAKINVGGETTIKELKLNKNDKAATSTTTAVIAPVPVVGVGTYADGSTALLTGDAKIAIDSAIDVALINRGDLTDEQWAAYRAYADFFEAVGSVNQITYEENGIYTRVNTSTLYHCVCTTKTGVHEEGCDGFDHAWTLWTKTNSMPNETGYWYLDSAKTYTTGITTGAVDIHIDLNGSNIKIAQNHRAYRFGGVAGGCEAKLTITDSVGGGKITIPEKAATAEDAHGIIIWGYRPSGTDVNITLNIYGGHLDASAYVAKVIDVFDAKLDENGDPVLKDGNKVNDTSKVNGAYGGFGAIYLGDTATINMYGGKVSGMTAAKGAQTTENGAITRSGKGGAFYLDSGTVMNMYNDAEIIGGVAAQNGGAVYICNGAKLYMHDDSKISGGKTQFDGNGTDKHGGNVFVTGSDGDNDGLLVLNDNAKILDGEARGTSSQGGNVYANGHVEIHDNALISGGMCVNGSTNYDSADIFLVGVNAVLTMDGGTVNKMSAAGGVGVINLSGTAKINRLKLNGDWTITVPAAFSGDAKIKALKAAADTQLIKLENVEESLQGDLATIIPTYFECIQTNCNFLVETDGVWVRSTQTPEGVPIAYNCYPYGCVGDVHVHMCPTGAAIPNLASMEWQPVSSVYNATSRTLKFTKSGNYYLDTDLSLANQLTVIPSAGSSSSEKVVVHLNLNGYNITSNWRGVQVWNNCELSLYNSLVHPTTNARPANGGIITGKASKATDPWATVQMVSYVDEVPLLNVYNGVTLKADENYTVYNGGGVVVGKGTFNMYGGKIIGCKVWHNDLHSGGNGGAVYVSSGATFNAYNGFIVGSEVENFGGAIYNLGTANVNNLKIKNGTANRGGAIYNSGTLTLSNVSISGSSAEIGDSIYSTTDISVDRNIAIDGEVFTAGNKLILGENLNLVKALNFEPNLCEGRVTSGASAVNHKSNISVSGRSLDVRDGHLFIATKASEGQLLVGFGSASVNPTAEQIQLSTLGYKDAGGYNALPIQGYGYNPAGTVVATQGGTVFAGLDLNATAIAYSDYDGDVIVMISVDSTSIGDAETMRREIAEYIKVPVDNVMLSATHAHSTPAARKGMYDFTDPENSSNTYHLEVNYYDTMLAGMKAAAKAALDDRSPIKNLYTATVEDVNELNSSVNGTSKMFNQVRNYKAYEFKYDLGSIYQSGEVYLGMSTPNHYEYQNISDADWLEPESEIDDDLQLVKYVRDGKTDIVIANFQTHPILFGTGGSGSSGIIHSDVAGSFRYQLSQKLGANVAYFSGAGGNVNSQPDTKMSTDNGNTFATQYTGSLAGCESWGTDLANIVNSKVSFTEQTNYSKDVSTAKTVVTYNRMVDTEIDGCNYSLALRREMAMRIRAKGVANLTSSSYSITTSCPDASLNQCTLTEEQCAAQHGDQCPEKVCTHGDGCPFNGVTYTGWQIRNEWKIYSYYHANTGLYNRRNNTSTSTGNLTLNAYAAGPIAFTAAPYEMFDTNGYEIKHGTVGVQEYADLGYTQQENPFEMTIVATKTTNISGESSGYVASRIGYANGGYSTDVSPYAAGTGEQLVTEFLAMLNGLKNN